MKTPIYWAIRTGSLYNPVIAVTSERGPRWSGREEPHGHKTHVSTTHGTMSDLAGRFVTLEAAQAAREKIAELADSYDKARNVLTREATRLYRDEQDAIDILVRGESTPLARMPTVTYQENPK